jgi:hydrogenase nickel incorporation protein HypB
MKINVVQNILAANNQIAGQTRDLLKTHNITAVNLISSPGAGKTAILECTLKSLQGRLSCGVIEGDIATTLDAERLTPFGFPVVQINTERFGGDCHLSASAVQSALSQLPLDKIQMLFIENVGNLVCPAEFDVGETAKVIVLSLPEGEDKPLKYPLAFREAKVCLLNKMDLAGPLKTDVDRILKHIHQINPQIPVFQISASTGQGLAAWIEWLEELSA